MAYPHDAKPIPLGIGFGKCKCTPEEASPSCRNRSTYVIDCVDGKLITLQECPNRFDDRELWRDIHFVLYTLKDWQGAASFLGNNLGLMHMSYTHYLFYEACFAARDRYQAQKASKEA